MPKQIVGLSGAQGEAELAASLSFALKNVKFTKPFYYRTLTITVNSKLKLLLIDLSGVNVRRLQFYQKDAKLLVACADKVLNHKYSVKFECLQILGNHVIMHLKY